MPKYFDIHSHLNSSKYDSDREEVIRRMQEADIHTIVVGTGLKNSREAVALAEKYESIYATVGVHPVDDVGESFVEKNFEKLVKHPKVVAVGECGLDFFHQEKEKDYDRQKKLFLAQINFAIKHGKPFMLHIRDAYDEALDILEPLKREHGKDLRGNVHFFAGDSKIAQRFFEIGFSISFTGVITFTSDYDDVIRSVPLEFIMSETDSPYVSPVPHRGKRNEPSYVVKVVKRISEIKNIEENKVQEALVQNALSMIR